MSHITTVKAVIKNLGILEDVAKGFGLTMDLSQKIYATEYSAAQECFGLITDGSEIGVAAIVEKDGEYALLIDSYRNPICEKVGDNCEKMMQQYAASLTKYSMSNVGANLSSQEELADGSLVLVFDM